MPRIITQTRAGQHSLDYINIVIRAVLDTNLLVSYLLTHRPPFAALIDHLARDHFSLLTSPELLTELDRVVRYEKLQRSYTDEERTRFVALVVALGEVGDLPVTIPRMCRDSDDDRLIACAVVGSLSRLLPTVA
jgi:putative PIN family toxin of toxin-antitoxin system